VDKCSSYAQSSAQREVLTAAVKDREDFERGRSTPRVFALKLQKCDCIYLPNSKCCNNSKGCGEFQCVSLCNLCTSSFCNAHQLCIVVPLLKPAHTIVVQEIHKGWGCFILHYPQGPHAVGCWDGSVTLWMK
jgi:hypothetical protein